MYKLIKNLTTENINGVCRILDKAAIPFDPANTDYQQFKADVLDGEELQDANGNPMSQAEANSFIATLP